MVTDLPILGNTVSCNLDNACETVTCCFVEPEIGRSITASVTIDTCKGEMVVNLERMKRTISLIGYTLGKFSFLFYFLCKFEDFIL